MFRKCVQISMCFSFLLACSSVPGEEWTQFRGSDYGRTSETQVNELWDASTVAWKTPLPGRGASSPVVFGENIYLTAYTGYGTTHENPGSESDLQRHLFCIAAADGSVVWKNTVPTTSPENPYNTWGVGKHGFASSSVAIDKTGIYVFYGATGALAFPGCRDTRSEFFLEGTLPEEVCPEGHIADGDRRPGGAERVRRGFFQWLRKRMGTER